MGRTPPCPNHGCEMDATDNPRKWICPVSGCLFEASGQHGKPKTQVRMTRSGTLETCIEVVCVDGEET